ncbi:MAG TPA: primosomal protein N', partial [Candidatus Acidoferrum sp.]|nr:primosomal protein N' [Candidatus Acidoferrum sp.]
MSAHAYCNVALPVPLRSLFTYSIPDHLRETIHPGTRVQVPFRKKSLIGVVIELTSTAPQGTKIRDITKSIDHTPSLTPKLIELGQWIANYYLAPVGEVFRAMLPPPIEIRTQRLIAITAAGRDAAASLSGGELSHGLSRNESDFLAKLAATNDPLPYSAAAKFKITAAAIDRLRKQNLIEIRESLLNRKQKTQRVIAWKTQQQPDASAATNLDEKTTRVRDQLTVRGPLPFPHLLRLASVSRAIIEKMLRANLLESWEERIDPADDPFDSGYEAPAHELNTGQESAFTAIKTRFELGEFGTLLLYGVTGSGKTEVYMRAVQETLARGKTAIVLVPEIALTLWVGRQCRAWFGARFEGVAVLHSALSDVERAREWWRVRNGEARVVVGTRSAVFAPLENLGLIIVDEEQESSYKQEETPRYHGRDVAIVRAKIENAIALLGSATPSLETYHNARQGKYELLTLPARVANRSMASVEIIDMREDFQRTHKAGPIGAALHNGITECLKQSTQALVLINRRGYSWSVLCRSCGNSIQCVNCSISMTYHKARNRLECHYCGSIQSVPKECPKCKSQYIYFFGEGSEHLEERLRKEFPGARIARLDRDTARTKRQYQETLGAFAGGAIDILVGTQMLAKGHDFQRVTLVGVISADSSLHLPDFRAAERTFQLLTQVAGRAGRGDLPGRVLIQTYYPEHYAIQDAVRQDYASFFDRETQFRRSMQYPPFTSLANVIIRDANLEKAIRYSRLLSEYFMAASSPAQPDEKSRAASASADLVGARHAVPVLPSDPSSQPAAPPSMPTVTPIPNAAKYLRVLGPATAPLARLKTEHRYQFLLKSSRRSVLTNILSGALTYADTK